PRALGGDSDLSLEGALNLARLTPIAYRQFSAVRVESRVIRLSPSTRELRGLFTFHTATENLVELRLCSAPLSYRHLDCPSCSNTREGPLGRLPRAHPPSRMCSLLRCI